jgi:hypothetical protein
MAISSFFWSRESSMEIVFGELLGRESDSEREVLRLLPGSDLYLISEEVLEGFE